MLSIAAALADVEFHGVEEAYARYVEYAKATRFAVRKGDSIKDESIMRGRIGRGRIRRRLGPAAMRTHSNINEGDKSHIHSMHEARFQTSRIMGFFAYLSGGYRNLHFIKKDVYNYIDDVRRSRIVQGDAAAAISYLKGKTEVDPLAIVMYTYCPKNHLGHLFWSDGATQYDYDCFGDVLAFDSTYRKNLYNRPLVIFSDTYHHRQTIIFGFGLLEDEKIPSYK
ncbi:hypothetical protein Ahy_B01g052598 isoform A [Arachis hypogaea]|uniref:MULE transposase domain-containing protein n=1 Tax=Arachis hypogaea TaxID=3818 RepID=A0A445APV0_ARAHY|nr:hypothetical protein Ahy_B01g052598 isoform A [Arachis hypogaea]